ncbi:unnamed protein product [Polarella glacialis]|uniref:Uncharacterized protein n=1 Tax=Polarella glacialis TaxID=89957 RepID=A0A813IL99_POLGL|nr:unnamed protein product [Polarella glacialis]
MKIVCWCGVLLVLRCFRLLFYLLVRFSLVRCSFLRCFCLCRCVRVLVCRVFVLLRLVVCIAICASTIHLVVLNITCQNTMVATGSLDGVPSPQHSGVLAIM